VDPSTAPTARLRPPKPRGRRLIACAAAVLLAAAGAIRAVSSDRPQSPTDPNRDVLHTPPPQCPPGQKAEWSDQWDRDYRGAVGWRCVLAVSDYNPGPEPTCPQGAHLWDPEGMGGAHSMCLAPRPICPRGFEAHPTDAALWECMRPLACPRGTESSFNEYRRIFYCVPKNGQDCPCGSVETAPNWGWCIPATKTLCEWLGWNWIVEAAGKTGGSPAPGVGVPWCEPPKIETTAPLPEPTGAR